MTLGALADPTKIAQTINATNVTTGVLTVEPDRSYSLVHLGAKADGTAETGDVYFCFGFSTGWAHASAPTADFSAEENKLILRDGQVVTLPPGITSIGYRAVAAAPDVMVQVVASPSYGGEGH